MKTIQNIGKTLVIGSVGIAAALSLGLGTASADSGDKVDYLHSGSYPAESTYVQSTSRSSVVGEAKDSFKAVPGEFADQAIQGVARDSFVAKPEITQPYAVVCGTDTGDGYGPAFNNANC